MILPGSLAAAAAAFAADPDLAFVYGDFDMIDGDGVTLRTYRSTSYSRRRVYERGCYIFSGSLFIRRLSLAAVGGFDPALRTCMDFDLLIRLDYVGRLVYLGRTIAQFRMHDASKSATIGMDFMWETFRRVSRRRPLTPDVGRRTLVYALVPTHGRHLTA